MIAGTWGINLILRTGKSLAGATSAEVVILSPDGQRLVKPATLDTVTGDITYVTEEGVFVLGDVDYQIQGIVNFASARKLKTDKYSLTVDGDL